MTNRNSMFARYVKLIVVCSVIASSSSSIFVNLIGAPPLAIGFWRLAIGVPFFAVPVLAGKRDELKALTRRDIFLACLAGVFLFGHFFTWFNAVKMTNVASAVTLAALHPLVVLAVTFFLYHQKVGLRPIMGIILALLGGAMIAGFDYRTLATDNFVGDIFAVFAAIFFGLYLAVGDEGRKRVSGPVYVLLVFATCLVCFAIGCAATGTKVLGYTAKDYALLVALTMICQVGAHAVFNLCIGYVDSLYVSTWETGESVFAIILGMIVLQQIPTQYQIIGCAVVVIGLLYYNFHVSKQQKKD
ncbi:MAG: DMT family transporter [Firmicutes bacterium]|nr:DMT family transporter [Bacillota bacterium]